MAQQSKIEWTDATWNPITGCTLVSEGCRNCYAATLAATRLKHIPSRKGLARMNAAGEAKFTGEVRFNEQWLDQPLRWRKPRMIFVCAHGDLFHESVPDAWIDQVFAVMALSPRHTFQVLTKRPERAQSYLAQLAESGPADKLAAVAGANHGEEADAWVANFIDGWSRPVEFQDNNPADGTVPRWPLPNVWIGTSVEDQATADTRIPRLLATPAAVRFLSAEPLLGEVDLSQIPQRKIGPNITVTMDALTGEDGTGGNGARLDWIIVGGESGPKARPMHPDWARSLRDQCREAGVAFFFKQWGEWGPCDHLGDDVDGMAFGCFNDAGQWCHPVDQDFANRDRTIMFRAGKRAAGRILDGREWNAVPERRA